MKRELSWRAALAVPLIGNGMPARDVEGAPGGASGPACASCAHFRNDPAYLESAIPGWTALGSAYGSTRALDGICELRGVFTSPVRCCDRFERAGS